MLKNKICILLVVLSLALPIYSEEFEDENIIKNDTVQQEEVVPQEEFVPQEDVQTDLIKEQLKQPVSKKRVVKKFLLAMLGVGISSFIIYAGLSMYNKLRDGLASVNKQIFSSAQDSPLNTPESLSEAVRTFIDKTKWN